MRYIIVLHYILIYYNIIFYIIARCIVLCIILLYGLALTASFGASHGGGLNGIFSKWGGDWPILSPIYLLNKRQADAFISYIHTSTQSFNR